MLSLVLEMICDDAWPCSDNWFGNIFLLLLYMAILAYGAKLISDGSEEIMASGIISPGLVGGLMLPLLGAVPDGILVLVSGLGSGSTAEIQNKLNVGIGTLAGSTIMLLTLVWASCAWVARVDIVNGEFIDSQCSSKSLTATGVNVGGNDLRLQSRILAITSISYMIIQGEAFATMKDPKHMSRKEKPYAIAALVTSCIFFIAYNAFMVFNTSSQEKKLKLAQEKARRLKVINAFSHSLAAKSTQELNSAAGKDGPDSENSSLLANKASSDEPINPTLRKFATQWALKSAEKRVVTIAAEIDAEEIDEEVSKTELIKAIALMLFGLGIVSIFSDPAANVMVAFANNIKVSPFYVSFVAAPLCSNASELISSLMFAAKKKKKNNLVWMSQSVGAAVMNSTFVLITFLCLIIFRNLEWDFSAETVAIIVVTYIMVVVAQKREWQTWWLIPIAILFPLSIGLVALLESPAVNWH